MKILSSVPVDLFGEELDQLYLSNDVTVAGKKTGGAFHLHFIEVPWSRQGQGDGQKTLAWLKKKYGRVIVYDPIEDALPFWKKMVKRGLVDELIFTEGENED